jgi:hypothetical protein
MCHNFSSHHLFATQTGQPMTIDELERAYAPLQDKVKDLREYL